MCDLQEKEVHTTTSRKDHHLAELAGAASGDRLVVCCCIFVVRRPFSTSLKDLGREGGDGWEIESRGRWLREKDGKSMGWEMERWRLGEREGAVRWRGASCLHVL